MRDQATANKKMDDIEDELKHVIVETLALQDVEPGDIDGEAALFGGGLALDSIDALELSVAIGRRYGVVIKADDERNREIFRSVRSLAAFIASERGVGKAGA
jgi:acyl carrier protein